MCEKVPFRCLPNFINILLSVAIYFCSTFGRFLIQMHKPAVEGVRLKYMKGKYRRLIDSHIIIFLLEIFTETKTDFLRYLF